MSIFDPVPTLPFCPNQTDFLTFRTEHGFGAIELNLIEGFLAFTEGSAELTTIHLSNGSQYVALDSVPELVARYAAVKHNRYKLERCEREVMKENTLVTAPAAPQRPPLSTGPAMPSGVWKKP